MARNIIVVQPALPAYRKDFFSRLSKHYKGTFTVFYSPKNMGALTSPQEENLWSRSLGPIVEPFKGVEWQIGALSIPIRKDDIVVVCGAPRNLTTLLLLVRIRARRAKSIWWGQYWSSSSKRWRLWLRIWLSRLSDGLLFYTDHEVQRFYAEGWRHPGPIGALNNGVPTEEIIRLRLSYSEASRGMRLLFIGRLTEKAELDLLFKAMTNSALSHTHLHIIGSGEKEQELRDFCERHHLSQRITWHGSTTDETTIAEIANRCAIFVYPGQVGLSLIHAMAYGLPSIVHNDRLRHMPEIAAYTDGVTGQSFETGSASSLARVISACLADRENLRRMSDACKVAVDNTFTTAAMAERFIEYVESFDSKNRTYDDEA